MEKYIVGLLMVCSLMFNGCKKKNDTQNNNNNNTQTHYPKILDVANANSLFIGQSATFKKSGESDTRLFKITEDGTVMEVTVKDDQGNDITTSVQPQNICNLNDKFFTATYQLNNNGEIVSYLVRKSDGAVFSGEKLLSKLSSLSSRTDLILQEDAAGNIYYTYQSNQGGSSTMELIKLNVSNPNALSTERYSAAGDEIWCYIADKNGNVFYFGKDITQKQITRFRHFQNGFTNFNTMYSAFFTDATKDNLYTLKNSFVGIEKKTIYKLNTATSALELSADTSGITQIRKSCTIKGRSKVLLYGNDQYFNNEYIFEFTGNNEVATAKIPISSFGLSALPSGNILPVEIMVASDQNYFILGNDINLKKVLLKIDGSNHSYTTMVLSSDYDIQQLVVGKDDELLFYGLRMSDGSRVLAKIQTNGNITILKVFNDMTVNNLERIN